MLSELTQQANDFDRLSIGGSDPVRALRVNSATPPCFVRVQWNAFSSG